MLTAEYLRECLDYDPIVGEFRWRDRPIGHFRDTSRRTAEHARAIWNSRYTGEVAGCINPTTGYRVIKVGDRLYKAHRLAWLLQTGTWPIADIDHVNLDPADNRFENIRSATRSKNLANTRARKDNTSGRKGVSWSKARSKWQVHIKISCRQRTIGYFDSLDAAAYETAAREAFGEFARWA